MQVIVLGMHRSGTSLLARVLNMMGLYFGTEGSSTGLNIENPKGFWERQDVRKLNDYILQKNGFDWNKIAQFEGIHQFNEETTKHFIHEGKKIILGMDAFRPWLLKEPRFCLNLPLWRQLLEVPLIIFIYRDPIEVAKSLKKRNNFPLEYGLAMWERYNEFALRFSKGLPRIIINHADLVNNPKQEVKRLKIFLEEQEVSEVRMPSDKEIYGFIEKKLHRNKVTGLEKADELLNASQKELLAIINGKVSISSYTFSKESKRALLNHEIKMEEFNSLKKELESLKSQQIQLQEQIELRNSTIVQLEKSQSDKLQEMRKKQEAAFQQLTSKFNQEIDGLNKQIKERDNQIIKQQLEFERRLINERIKELQAKLAQQSAKTNEQEERWIKKIEEWEADKEKWQKEREGWKTKEKHFVEIKKRLDNELEATKSKQERIKQLNSIIAEKDRIISIKDKLINDYWDLIQKMRLSNRLKKLAKFEFVKKVFFKFIWKLKVLKYKWSVNKKAKAIESFVRDEFNHTLSEKSPLVSIIILNKDGVDHLRKLFKFLLKNTIYPNYEIIVFDNKSTDDSLNYLKSLKDIRIKIIENHFNDSFSSANNKAASEAKGDLLLFLNNDVMPLYGWLNQLVKTYLKSENVGTIGAKLIYPKNYYEKDTLKVQHNGIGFKLETGFIRPYNLDNKRGFFDLKHKADKFYPSVTAACVMVNKSDFDKIGGFDENYNYGYEDVDLGLKFFTKGMKNVVAHGAVLYHNEFGTQKTQDSLAVQRRRQKNLEHFRKKWYKELLATSWEDKLNGNNRLSLNNPQLTIGITVTEQGKYARAGDYFTAKELAQEFIELGYKVRFFAQKEDNWYQIHDDVDILLVLLHGYDLNKVESKNKELIKAAWIRNWFDKFSDTAWFDQFDLVFSSSKKACKYIENEKRKKAYYLPIATNENRFGRVDRLKDKEYQCDYCFTGSYWNDPREIIDMLNPKRLSEYDFNLYGKNWDQVEKLSDYNKGFVKYDDIPKVYANTRLLIDDANRVTKPWGSVNSRVFDAIMSGVLVITNGEMGSKDVFQSKLPVYSNAEELEQLVRFYLENEEERLAKVKDLQSIVKTKHTYKHRAEEIKSILTNYYKQSLVIKIPVPSMKVAHQWGDYHFALSLQKEFEKKAIRTKVELLPDWDSEQSYSFSNVLVLRGLSVYLPQPFQFNMMWNISHPDKVDIDEYRSYDHVFVASEKWAEHLKDQGFTNVSTLLQCTDPDVFKIPKKNEKVKSELLFVGNSRGVYRKIIDDLLPTDHELSIYGAGWKNLVDEEYVKGEHIDNKELYKYYGGAKVVLNDHWEDMRKKGFISNRIFDALACGANIISDNVGKSEIIKTEAINFYESKKELKRHLKKIIKDNQQPYKKKKVIREYITKHHTFKARVDQILKVIKA